MLRIARLVFSQADRGRQQVTEGARASLPCQKWLDALAHYRELTSRVIVQTERRVLHGEQVPSADKLVSLFEPHTQAVLIRKVDTKASDAVRRAMSRMLRKFKPVSHTLTLDNGKEFSQHEKLSKDLKIRTYFADPYASWQRGLNEQINGLIRQYLPKSRRFDDVSDEELALIEKKLNNRPRKMLGFNTPKLEFQALAERESVALRL